MKPIDFVIILVLAAFLALALWYFRRRKKKGGGCCGGCSGCAHAGSCSKNPDSCAESNKKSPE